MSSSEPPGPAPSTAVELTAMRTDYNQCSRGQRQLLEQFKPLLDAAVAAHASLDHGAAAAGAGPFVLADFGCSTGLNSSDAISYVIGRLRERYGLDRCPSVLAVLNDLPRNGWSELHGFIHEDGRSFLRQHTGVCALSSGQTFYEQTLPDNSLQFGISSVCLQWCSRLPVRLAGHCVSMFASAGERELFKRQAADDWANFLEARSRELVKGGVLAVNFVTSEDGADGLYREIYTAAMALRERSVICEDELANFNIRMHFRSVDEVTDNALYDALGLELLVVERFPSVLSVYYQDFLVHKDADRFASDCSNTMSSACEPSFLSALSSKRSVEEKNLICSELWKEYRDRIAEHPDATSNIWGAIGVVIRRK